MKKKVRKKQAKKNASIKKECGRVEKNLRK